MLLVAHGHGPGRGAGAAAVLLWLGAGLGTAAIPFYYVGYSRALRVLGAAGAWHRLARLGAVLVAIFGAATHGLTALDIHTAMATGRAARPPEEAFADWPSPLSVCALAAAAGALLAAAAIVAAAVRSARLPLKVAGLLNPITWTVLLGAAATASELTLAYLGPSAPNLAHCLFFGLMAFLARRAPRA